MTSVAVSGILTAYGRLGGHTGITELLIHCKKNIRNFKPTRDNYLAAFEAQIAPESRKKSLEDRKVTFLNLNPPFRVS